MIISFLLQALFVSAFPDTSKLIIDIRRVKLHEDIDKLQVDISQMDGKKDLFVNLTGDNDLDLLITDYLTRQVDEMQQDIEKSAVYDHRIKVKYLSGLLVMLNGLNEGLASGSMSGGQAPVLFDAYKKLVAADFYDTDLLGVAVQYPYSINQILLGPKTVFFDNKGLLDVRIHMYKQYATLYPEKALKSLDPFLEQPFADSVIISSANRFPAKFYDYAAASATRLGKKIRLVKDSTVQLIVKFSDDKSGRLLFPFMHAILRNRIGYDSVKQLTSDEVTYFKLLVATQTQYLDDMRRRDTPVLHQEIGNMIARKAEDIFINEINALHEEVAEKRFAILKDLGPEDLYYIMVTGEDVIYTSSYVGLYNAMMSRLPKSAGDSLLMKVRFDKFRKFIKMAAGYNRLDLFLKTMPDSTSRLLMKAFVRGLEKGLTLEDAVDVADSYSSISDSLIRALVQTEIKRNLVLQKEQGNMRGAVIYDILDLLFRSVSDSGLMLSAKYHIPPPFQVQYDSLSDKAGRVVQQVFFYGDKDGIESFASFMSQFINKPEWKVLKNDQWVEIRSLIGKQVWIYANLPLENKDGDDPDAKAQEMLNEYLKVQGLEPSIVIHRGHSYHLKYTIEQLPTSAKIIVLGSCGSYQNLNAVITICPEAHIISSKEVGTRIVNEPILKSINETLRKGESVDWITMWQQLQKQFSTGVGKERFENYIPPHKNLGALFIKAFNNTISKSGEQN